MTEISVVNATSRDMDTIMEEYLDSIRNETTKRTENSMVMEFLDDAIDEFKEGYRSLDDIGRTHPKRAEAVQDFIEMHSPAIRQAMAFLHRAAEGAQSMDEDGDSMTFPGEVFNSTERLCDAIRDAGKELRAQGDAIRAEEKDLEHDIRRIEACARSLLDDVRIGDEAKSNIKTLAGDILAITSVMEQSNAMFRENGDVCKPYQMCSVYTVYRSSVKNTAERMERIAKWHSRAASREDSDAWAFAVESLAETADMAKTYFGAIGRELAGRYREGNVLSGALLEIPPHGGKFEAHDTKREAIARASKIMSRTGGDFSRNILRACLQQNVGQEDAVKMLGDIQREIGIGLERVSLRTAGRKIAAAR